MTSERLYETLARLDALDTSLNLQKAIERVSENLSTLVTAPAQPGYQAELAAGLQALREASLSLRGALTPSQQSTLEAMGGEEFFDPEIGSKVTALVQANAMTPSVARDAVNDMATKRAQFLAYVRGARQNLSKLGVKGPTLPSGGADIAFLIPRELFDDQLGALAKELNFISRLMQDFSEALTGEAQQPKLEQLSSSVPTVALLADIGAILMVAKVVDKFLSAWEKIEKIRRIRGELTEMGMRGQAVEELTEQITTTVETVVEESTQMVIAAYPQQENGRKSELTNALRQDTKRLFGQIERGLTVEVHATAKDDKGGGGGQLKEISDLGRKLKYPEIGKEPFLLGAAEVLEGEIKTAKVTRSTTTTSRISKPTAGKRDLEKEGKSEA